MKCHPGKGDRAQRHNPLGVFQELQAVHYDRGGSLVGGGGKGSLTTVRLEIYAGAKPRGPPLSHNKECGNSRDPNSSLRLCQHKVGDM